MNLFPTPFGVNVSSIFHYYIITVDTAYAWVLIAAFTAVFAMAVPWLVNRPQPTPRAEVWRVLDSGWKAAYR